VIELTDRVPARRDEKGPGFQGLSVTPSAYRSGADAGGRADAECRAEKDLAEARLLQLDLAGHVLRNPRGSRRVRRLGVLRGLPRAERDDLTVALDERVRLESRLGLEDRKHPLFRASRKLLYVARVRVPRHATVHVVSSPAAPVSPWPAHGDLAASSHNSYTSRTSCRYFDVSWRKTGLRSHGFRSRENP